MCPASEQAPPNKFLARALNGRLGPGGVYALGCVMNATPGPVIVCGMGYVGYRIVVLLRRLGEAVTVVTQDARGEWRRDAEGRGVRLLVGDARDAALLAEAGLLQARALIAATDQDVANVEIALDAKKARKDLPVVIRLFDQHLARQMELSFDIRRAFAVSSTSL